MMAADITENKDAIPVQFIWKDVVSCPCCKEDVPNVELVDRLDVDLGQLEERIAYIKSLVSASEPEMPLDRVDLMASIIAIIAAYHNGLPGQIKEIEEKYAQLSLPIGYVYFIQGVNGGPIKIGYSLNPERRARDLETADRLIVLACFPGDRYTEHKLHHRFSGLRLNGEWFRPGSELLEFIEEVKANNG